MPDIAKEMDILKQALQVDEPVPGLGGALMTVTLQVITDLHRIADALDHLARNYPPPMLQGIVGGNPLFQPNNLFESVLKGGGDPPSGAGGVG